MSISKILLDKIINIKRIYIDIQFNFDDVLGVFITHHSEIENERRNVKRHIMSAHSKEF